MSGSRKKLIVVLASAGLAVVGTVIALPSISGAAPPEAQTATTTTTLGSLPAATTTSTPTTTTTASGAAQTTTTTTTATMCPTMTTSITEQPTSQTVTAGATATFTAEAMQYDCTVTIQWFESTDGGQTFNAITGASLNSLVIPDASTSQSGDEFYAQFYANGAFAIRSNTVTLTVQPATTTTTTTASAVYFDDWTLGGTIKDAKLGQTITLPAGARINGTTMTIPNFTAPLKLFGVPAELGLSLTETGPLTEAVIPDPLGELHATFTGGLNLAITSIDLLGLHFPLGCASATPIALSLSTPILADPTYFGGPATIPAIRCHGPLGGLFGPLLTAELSGPGNAFALYAASPSTITTTTTTTTSTGT